jgi:hypothetical protein
VTIAPSGAVWQPVTLTPHRTANASSRWDAGWRSSTADSSIWLFSVPNRSAQAAQAAQERGLFETQPLRSETGLRAAGASGH